MKKLTDIILENQILCNDSKYSEQDIINIEKNYAASLVGFKFKLTYTATTNDLFVSSPSFDFNPMSKEINHVFAHMIESYMNPKAVLKYSNKTSNKLDIDNIEIKTSYKDLDENGKTPNKQKLYFSSISQYNNLKQKDSILLYIYYNLNYDTLEATIKKVYVRSSNMIEASKHELEQTDENGNTLLRHPCKMCITKLLPITKGNGIK